MNMKQLRELRELGALSVLFREDGKISEITFTSQPAIVNAPRPPEGSGDNMFDLGYESGRKDVFEMLDEDQKMKLREREEIKLRNWSS